MKRAAAMLMLAASACQAQDGLNMGPPGAKGFGGLLGLGVMEAPRYAGADTARTRAVPLVQLRWGDGWFAGTDGVGYRFGEGAPWSAALRLGLDRGRKEADSPALRGMGDTPTRADLGVSASVRLLPFLMAGAGLKFGSGEHRKGLVADLSLRAMVPLSRSARLMLGVSGHWANEAAMQSGFGVNASQSLASGYALYQPNAGWRDWGPSAMGMVELGGAWQLMLRVEQRHLLGDAKASPLVRDSGGTRAMVTLGWRF
jgi:outer membrane protein